jgi:nicotinamidase-related amidase
VVTRTTARPRPSTLLLFLVLLQIAVLDAGGLSAGIAFAATATAVGAALLACAVLTARCAPAVPPTRVRTALRDRARRTAFLPQRDPDAAGRPRPRAPGHALPATA